MGKLIILVNNNYLLFFLRDIHNGYLSLKKANKNQRCFANQLENFQKGTKALEKKYLLNNLGLLFSAKKKFSTRTYNRSKSSNRTNKVNKSKN